MPRQSRATVRHNETEYQTSPTPAEDAAEFELYLEQTADALFRTAAECCRQHQRYACLIETSAGDHELDAAFELVTLCDEQLARISAAYEIAGTRGGVPRDQKWWHTANILWLASREYVLHHQEDDGGAREFRTRSVAKLAELAMQADLAASALLALRHALSNYRKVRPEAELAA